MKRIAIAVITTWILASMVWADGAVQAGRLPSSTITLDSSATYQTIEGLGGATAFYNNWITAHPYKQEIFEHAFAGLNLSMLRLGNWWRGVDGQDTDVYEIVAAAQSSLGRDVPIMMSSWSPPATLKSNGRVDEGGTLVKVNGRYDYEGFAEYWADSIQDYNDYGISPTWISIQNEPAWTASYDSCRFNPTEARWNGEYYASYALALDAVYEKLQNDMDTPPKLLGPEVLGIGYNLLHNFLPEMNPESYYGIAHHLYHGGTDGTTDGYNEAFEAVLDLRDQVCPGKPVFMTEYGDFYDLIECANLIHNSLAIEQVSGYNHWTLIWPGQIGLIEIENPWSSGQWTHDKGYWLNPSYWSFKHYSAFIDPGFLRIEADSSNDNLLTSAYLSPNQHRMVVVMVNRSDTPVTRVEVECDLFDYDYSYIYQTTDVNHFESLGELQSAELIVPASSITTVVLDREITLEPASDPHPIHEADEVASQETLYWQPDPNALQHAVYLGTDYQAVATATLDSPEYQGTVFEPSFKPTSLSSTKTYYWRVDETVYSSVNTGEVWSFTTSENTSLWAQFEFNEGSGTQSYDSSSNAWIGTLVNGAGWTTGLIGSAVALDGSNDYIHLPEGIVNGLDEVTFAVWVNLDAATSWSRIFDFGTGTSVNCFLTPNCWAGARFAITNNGSGAEQTISIGESLPTKEWSHMAITLDGSKGIFYLNGQEAGRNNGMTLTPDALGNTHQNYLGKSQYSWDPYLDGILEDFRIYAEAIGSLAVLGLASP